MTTPFNRRRRILQSAAALAAASLSGHARAIDWAFWRGSQKGSGKVMREQRPLEPIHALRLGGSTKLELRQSDRDFVEIETDDNLLALIEVPVRDGVLRIEPEGSIRPTRLSITVHARQVETIDVGGSAAVLCDRWTGRRLKIGQGGSSVVRIAQLDVEELMLDAGGSTVAHLAGRAARIEVLLGGSSVLSAKHLQAVEGRVRTSGSAQAVAWVTERLDAQASGLSGLRYYGSPKADANRSGSAVITPLGAEPTP
jgi:nicotinamidase-related amidase